MVWLSLIRWLVSFTKNRYLPSWGTTRIRAHNSYCIYPSQQHNFEMPRLSSLLALAAVPLVLAHGNHQTADLTAEEIANKDAWFSKYGKTGDLSFTGVTSFAHLPHVRCLDEPGQELDVAIIGMPFDSAVSFRPGARFGPFGIRSGEGHFATSVSSWETVSLTTTLIPTFRPRPGLVCPATPISRRFPSTDQDPRLLQRDRYQPIPIRLLRHRLRGRPHLPLRPLHRHPSGSGRLCVVVVEKST